MRRILRKIAANEHDQLGDTTTLADPSVVQSLVDERKCLKLYKFYKFIFNIIPLKYHRV